MELSKLKILLGMAVDDTACDAVLQFIIDDVEEIILNYCNIKVLPNGLRNTAYRMAVDLYRYEKPGDSNTQVMVSSISEGDTSTSFTNMPDVLNGGILKNYKSQLNRYRRLK